MIDEWDSWQRRWELCERLTIFQAIMLALKADPGGKDQWMFEEQASSAPRGYWPLKEAFVSAAQSDALDAKCFPVFDHRVKAEVPGSIDLDKSTINAAMLHEYMTARGHDPGYLPKPTSVGPPYLDRAHDCYPEKLAAAVEAWLAVTEKKAFELRGTPKQAIEKWLHENSSRFKCLRKSDGSINVDAIEQIAKVANWQPQGGAGKSTG